MLQGATEFLPISSSGHLVVVPRLVGWDSPPLSYDAAVHLGTLVAVLILFRRELAGMVAAGLRSLLERRLAGDPQRRLAWLVAAATAPAVLAGLLLEEGFERLFADPRATGLLLLVTAGLLLAGERLQGRRLGMASLTLLGALLIGLAQAASIAPGISRSGATIAAGLAVGLSRRESARFSFLLSAPIILGASTFQLVGLGGQGWSPELGPAIVIGFLAALVTGAAAIRGLIRYLGSGSLHPFSAYLVALAGLTLWVTR